MPYCVTGLFDRRELDWTGLIDMQQQKHRIAWRCCDLPLDVERDLVLTYV